MNLHHRTCDSIGCSISPVRALLKRLPRKLKISGMQLWNFRVMTSPAKGGKPDGTKGKGKMHKRLGFQPERGEQRKFCGYCNWCWRNGHEAQCWFEKEYMKSNPSQDPLQRDIHEWSNTSEKGQGHSQPKGKGKVKRKTSRKREPQPGPGWISE